MEKYTFVKAMSNPMKYTKDLLSISKNEVISFYHSKNTDFNELSTSNIRKILKDEFPMLILPKKERLEMDISLLIFVLFQYMWENHLETCIRLCSNYSSIDEGLITPLFQSYEEHIHDISNRNVNSLYIKTILNPLMRYQKYITPNSFDMNRDDAWMITPDSFPTMKFHYLFSLLYHYINSDECNDTLLDKIIPLKNTLESIEAVFKIVNKLKEE